MDWAMSAGLLILLPSCKESVAAIPNASTARLVQCAFLGVACSHLENFQSGQFHYTQHKPVSYDFLGSSEGASFLAEMSRLSIWCFQKQAV